MSAYYCTECAFLYEEEHAACPGCGGLLEPWGGSQEAVAPARRGAHVDAPEPVRDTRPYAEREPDRGSIGAGFGIGMLLHLLQLLVVFEPFFLLFFGITQLAYMLPAMMGWAIAGKGRTVGGLAICLGVTFFANCLLFGLICASFMEGGWH